MATTKTALEITNLRKRYGRKIAVDDLSLLVASLARTGRVAGAVGTMLFLPLMFFAGLAILAGYPVVFGLLAWRLFRWE